MWVFRINQFLHINLKHFWVDICGNGHSIQTSHVLFHAATWSKMLKYKLNLLLVGWLPENQRKFWIFRNPIRKSIPTISHNLFVEDIEISISFVMVSRINWIVGTCLQKYFGLWYFSSLWSALRSPFPITYFIIFQDKTLASSADEEVLWVLF